MLDRLYKFPATVRRLRAGPFGQHLDGFATALLKQDYQPSTVRIYLADVGHLGRWRGRKSGQMDESTVADFEAHLPNCHCRSPYQGRPANSVASARVGCLRFLEYLRTEGIVQGPQVVLYRRSFTTLRLRRGPLGQHLLGFAEALLTAGYHPATVRVYVVGASHFGAWLKGRQSLASLDDRTLRSFQKHLAKCSCRDAHRGQKAGTDSRVRQGARRLLEYLRKCGVVRPSVEAPAHSRMQVVDAFCTWLKEHRGSADTTLKLHSRYVEELVREVGEDLRELTATRLRTFVTRSAGQYSRARTQSQVSSLRMFVRFLSSRGDCSADLVAAVPSVAHWRLAALPRYLPAATIESILQVCAGASAIRLRDRAVLLLLARLGLRAGDARDLRLSDIDWEKASVRVTGKSRREVRLPLPQDVGEAILAYLQHGRPRVKSPVLFLSTWPPFKPLGSTTVSSIARLAMKRAGVEAPHLGAHVLRHSAATQLLREGASLQDIGAVLRHSSMETTAHYAKVDFNSLREVAQPWPEVQPC